MLVIPQSKVMEVSTSQQPTQHKSSCAECQRRKQKCNRQWPCNHCQKRKVADKCRFNIPTNLPVERPLQLPKNCNQKRSRVPDDDDNYSHNGDASDADSDGPGIEAIGYMTGPLLSSLRIEPKTSLKLGKQIDMVTPETCPPLKQALNSLPPRLQMDMLVQEFFSNVNFHYYIIYPRIFLKEYQEWWDRRDAGKPLSLQWTSLLMMVCACATQHLDSSTRPKVELELGMSANDLSELYHSLARELSNSIPVGHYHLLNLQRLLHSIYWFKAEARFVEAWHVIGAAVREAQELGLHKEVASEDLPEFDREMRRRVWCVLATWDWQFASGLCRPTIIDHTDVDIGQPSLTLDDLSPSPLLHMKLQADVIGILAEKFQAPKNVQTPAQIQQYRGVVEDWMRSFPAIYDIDRPDRSKDEDIPWVRHHRFYIHTMAFLMILNPIRAYMAKSYTDTSSADELEVRRLGVDYSLRNIETTSCWTDHVHEHDGRFHFIIFSLFDTASVLVAAAIKDDCLTLPRRSEVLEAIDKSVNLLRHLTKISKTAKTSYDILSRLVRRLPRLSKRDNRKRTKINAMPIPVPFQVPLPTVQALDTRGVTFPTARSEDLMNSHQYGSETTSPGSNFCETISSGSTPASHATPESAPTSLEPTINENIMYTLSNQPQMSFDGYNMGMPMPGMAPPGMEMVQSYGSFEPMPTMYTDLHNPNAAMVNDPYAHDPYTHVPFEPITDAEMGDFSRLWDWQTLDLDFISSESAPLPPTV